jgi:hypothetical protein
MKKIVKQEDWLQQRNKLVYAYTPTIHQRKGMYSLGLKRMTMFNFVLVSEGLNEFIKDVWTFRKLNSFLILIMAVPPQ